jgi:hypothetical protein
MDETENEDEGATATLADRAYDPLPLGTVRPRGWLRDQLELQAEALTGHLDEFWPDLADNAWRGGDRDGWERGPYYADGLVPLAHLLDDEALLAKAERWIEGFLDAQTEAGRFVPATVDEGYDPWDPWPRAVVLKALVQHYEVTGDEQALDAVLAYCRYLHRNPGAWSLHDWSRMRWADLAVTVHWAHERTGAGWLLDLSELLAARGYDWIDHFRDFRYPSPVPLDVQGTDEQMPTHVVNQAMGLKTPVVRWRRSLEGTDREASGEALDVLDSFHGQATGLFTGDEHLGGKDSTRGTELCAVVEFMYSLEHTLAITGDPRFGDRLERIAYNALPATFTPDMWAHQYDQQANQALCSVAERPWTNGPDANVFGLEPNYGCCTANLHQGWPKFVAHLWMAREGGLAAVTYGPSEVTTDLDGSAVTVRERTDYPFDDSVTFEISVDAAATFALELRIPEWCDAPTLRLPDGDERTPESGTFHTVEREWADGDAVELSLPAPLRGERRHQGAVSLSRGPLVFARNVAAEERRLAGDEPYADREFHPAEPWNYGLDVDPTAPEGDLERSPPGDVPFSPDDPPVEVAVDGARVPEWGLAGSNAGPIPASPTVTEAEPEPLTLVPYGCTTLRITEFPLVE